ncbi:hypothetical protein SG34_007140 [Thalassomonas viridans]|uniref:Uncharacterized protein n=1 Tax=Thalassomonas viridans TaxID=137584 RepID=A0AAF0C8P6_9GAMM|nr:hypothetical protein [Thalassomonas viridans]WDE06672.1 hypothetical protein SG34_007140 [Thalassomonas viridans]
MERIIIALIAALACVLVLTGFTASSDSNAQQSEEETVIVGNSGKGWDPIKPTTDPTILDKIFG